MLNKWVVNFGSGVLAAAGYAFARYDNTFLYIVCILAIVIWNYAEGIDWRNK